MQIPVTEAFNDPAWFVSRPVELRPDQIAWLEERAAERGLSIGHVLRSIVADRMRGADDSTLGGSGSRESVLEESGDGTVRPPAVNMPRTDVPGTANAEDTGTPGSGKEDKADRVDSPSVVERLRSASKRLQDITDGGRTDEELLKKEKTGKPEDASEDGLRDTLARFQAYVRRTSLEDDSKDNTPTVTSSADSPPDAGGENASKTPRRKTSPDTSMFDMMDGA